MGINVADNFNYQGAKPLDARFQYTSVANMKAATESSLYNGCMAYVTENKKYYTFDSSNSSDATTGKWREFESGGGEDTNAYHTSDTAETTIDDTDYFPFYDTSASGKKKSLWSNIKTVLANTFQPKLTAGTNIDITNSTISALATVDGFFGKSSLYSTTEKVIGCWTDGRPLYQKVIDFGAGANRTVKSVSHGVSNINTLVDLHFFGQMGSGSTSSGSLTAGMCDATFEYFNDNGNVSSIAVYLIADKIYMDARHDASMYNYKVVIKYTKTSDAANSFNYADVNDYSTSEKIVGTWVNGANLYQRTFTGTTSSSANITTVSSALGSAVVVRKFEGYIYWDSSHTAMLGSVGLNTSASAYDAFSSQVYTNSSNAVEIVYGNDFKGKSYAVTIQYTR